MRNFKAFLTVVGILIFAVAAFYAMWIVAILIVGFVLFYIVRYLNNLNTINRDEVTGNQADLWD